MYLWSHCTVCNADSAVPPSTAAGRRGDGRQSHPICPVSKTMQTVPLSLDLGTKRIEVLILLGTGSFRSIPERNPVLIPSLNAHSTAGKVASSILINPVKTVIDCQTFKCMCEGQSVLQSNCSRPHPPPTGLCSLNAGASAG